MIVAPDVADASGCTIVANPTPTNYTNCPGAMLPYADLSNQNLDYANLSGANLQHADLSGSTLASADLASANLQYAQLTSTSIINAMAEDANFDDVYSTDVSFSGTHLDGASFTGSGLIPNSQTAEATSEAGANVSYFVPYGAFGARTTGCDPAPGTLFPPGETTASCTVVDDYGGVATGTFVMDVTVPTDLAAQPAVLSTTGNVLQMSAHLTDAFTGAPLVAESVSFYAGSYSIQGSPTCSASTNTDGIASCSLLMGQRLEAVVGDGGYTAVYFGSVRYEASFGSGGLVGTG